MMLKVKISILLFFEMFLLSSSYSQNFEFLRTFGGKTSDYIVDMSAENKGGSTFLLISEPSMNLDTLHFDSINIIKNSKDQTSMLVKLDSNGKVLRVIKLPDFGNSTRVCRDSSGNFYISGGIKGTITIDTLTLASSNGAMVFAKFDKNLNFKWATQTGNDKSSVTTDIIYSNGHLYFICVTNDTTKIGTKTYYLGLNFDYLFGELNLFQGNVIWSNTLFKGNKYARLTTIVNLKGSLYFSGDFGLNGSTLTPQSKFAIGSDTVFGPGGFVLQTDTLGNYKSMINLYNKKNLRVNCLCTDGEFLYFGGDFIDSLKWGNQKIAPTYPTGGGASETELFAASITIDLQPRWFFRPKILIRGGHNAVMETISNQGYIYFGAIMAAKKVLIDSNTLSTAANADLLLFKTDFLGNILWATNGGTSNKDWIVIQSMDAVAGKSIFASGYYLGNIKLGKFKYSGSAINSDGWITKISDFSITRGKVRSGPYCAGDTIRIPFTKFGNFDTSNYFIAQLSNEQGNFDSSYRELGRLKISTDGTIIGRLPLFQVSSSPNYRIRILSTSPPVQSYYKRDSLRLLIYSRDKANPGSPETICLGDTIKLNTYGGTKWTWSPNYNMNNTSFRQPLVWPTKDTVYRIIISDSSGCGVPDTAYKKILLRSSLEAVLPFTDTSLCQSSLLQIPAQFKGGDSSAYQYEWYFIYPPNSWFKLRLGKQKLADTLQYTPTDPNEKLALVLSDGCTVKKDTFYLNIHLRTPVNLKSIFKDTLLCFGNQLIYKAKATSNNLKTYNWQWKDITHNTILSSSDSLILIAKQTSKIELTVNDGCIALGDTQQFTVFVNPPLKTSILTDNGKLNDTAVCYNQNIKLFSSGKGGTGTGYAFKWYLDKTLLSTQDTLHLNLIDYYPKSGGIKALKLTLRDNCTKDADSVTKTIKVIESPKADFSVVNTCNLNPIQFTFTGTKPTNPITTVFLWNFAGETTSGAESPLQQLNNTGNKAIQLKLTASNGCIDIITKNISIKPQAKANFDVDDVCEGSPAIFINKTIETAGIANYRWYFGDGNTSSADTPAHPYYIGGITKTFNVKLAANISNGCSDSITKAVTVNANPKQGFTYTTSGQTVNFTATESSATNYKWTFGDGGTSSSNNRQSSYIYSKLPSGKYIACLSVTNLAGCTSDSCIEIQISGSVYLTNSLRGVKVYPNPNTGNFIIQIDEPIGETSVEIYSLLGQVVYKTRLNQSINKLDLSLVNGIYLVKVINKKNSYCTKIVVSR